MKMSSIDVGLNTANGIWEQTVISLQIYANAVYANITLMGLAIQSVNMGNTMSFTPMTICTTLVQYQDLDKYKYKGWM